MSTSSSFEQDAESNSPTRIEDGLPRQSDAHVISNPLEVNIQTPVDTEDPKRSPTSRKRKILMPSNGEKKQCLRGEKKQRPGIQSSIGNVFSTIPIQCRNSDRDMLVFLDRIRGELREILMEELARRKSFKFYLTVSSLLHRINVDGDVQTVTPYLHSRPAIVMHTTDLDAETDTAATRLAQLLECFEDQGSGYTLSEHEQCHVNISTFDVIGGSSFIELPVHVKVRNAVSTSEILTLCVCYIRFPMYPM